MSFYIAQLLICLYAFCAAKQQGGIVKDYKNYVPIGTQGVKGLHKFGALKVVLFGVLVCLIQQGVYAHLAAPFVAFLWYSLVFDLVLNKATNMPLLYVGHTSSVDQWLNARFGRDAGKRKVQVCVAIIVLINVGYTIL